MMLSSWPTGIFGWLWPDELLGDNISWNTNSVGFHLGASFATSARELLPAIASMEISLERLHLEF